jgi:hypothetical protein
VAARIEWPHNGPGLQAGCKTMWRRIIPAIAIAALLTGTAHAQSLSLFPQPGDQRKDPEEIAREKAIEQDYNEAASKIPDKKPATNDPWGGVRSAPAATASKKRSQ